MDVLDNFQYTEAKQLYLLKQLFTIVPILGSYSPVDLVTLQQSTTGILPGSGESGAEGSVNSSWMLC